MYPEAYELQVAAFGLTILCNSGSAAKSHQPWSFTVFRWPQPFSILFEVLHFAFWQAFLVPPIVRQISRALFSSAVTQVIWVVESDTYTIWPADFCSVAFHVTSFIPTLVIWMLGVVFFLAWDALWLDHIYDHFPWGSSDSSLQFLIYLKSSGYQP